MNPSIAHLHPAATDLGRIALAGVLLILAGLAAYANTLAVPFLYDDEGAIVRNASIRRLWPLSPVLFPPHATAYEAGLTTSGRPVLNVSLALNHALSGEAVWSYHAFNLLIHLAAGLVLFGVVRRTLLRRADGGQALGLAFASAVLWMLHPLQVESVTYLVQRAESLMGLFYLLTLYAFVRGVQAEQPRRWWALCVTSCALGMATKEVMVTAPLMVLLYDRTFVAGTLAAAWRQRRRVHGALLATWVPLAALVWSTGGNRGGTAGFGVGVSPWAYGLTQFEAVVRYLALSVWPHPLVFEYGTFWTAGAGEVLPFAAVLLPLLAGAMIALWRWPAVGFAGAWFFAILAPTSLTPGTQQMIVEHRVYLSLAAVVTLLVVAAEYFVGRRARWALGPALLACGLLTVQRNADYRSEIALWSDTIAKRPGNARAHYNLGHAFSVDGRFVEARREYLAALQLKPDYAEADNNLGNALSHLGRLPEAIGHYEEALRLRPDYANAHYNLGCALVEAGRLPEAIASFEQSVRLQPTVAEVRYNLAGALAQAGRNPDALAEYASALQLRGDYVEALNDRGNLLLRLGRTTDALADFEAAVRIAPSFAGAHLNYAAALLTVGRTADALTQSATAVRLQPDSGAMHYNLGNVLLQLERLDEAVAEYREAARLAPALVGAHHNLALALVRLNRPAEAIAPYERALQLAPDSAVAHHNFAIALAEVTRLADAAAQDETALRLQPDFPDARRHLSYVRERLAATRENAR